MPSLSRPQILAAVVGLALWLPATGFFATVGLLVARELAGHRASAAAPIADLRGALVTAAYSLGGAAIGLGVAWLGLPPSRRRGVGWAAGLWAGVTALLLGTRHVSGWPLLVAAGVATAIGVDVGRRLLAGLLGSRGAPPPTTRGA